MAATWVLEGDSSGKHFVNARYVESLILERMSTRGVYTVRIRTISGKEYYSYFPSYAEVTAFVNMWAADTVTLDAEPAPTLTETEVPDGVL